MRCPDCNKFVSQELGDPENQNLEVSPAGHVSAEVRVFVTCADCGTELKETTLSLEKDCSEQLKGHLEGDPGTHELEIEEEQLESLDDYKRVDRRGKPIKNARYQTHLYGARLEFKITCSCQADEDDAKPLLCDSLEDLTEASAMDELA